MGDNGGVSRWANAAARVAGPAAAPASAPAVCTPPPHVAAWVYCLISRVPPCEQGFITIFRVTLIN